MPEAVDGSQDTKNGLKVIWPENQVVDYSLEIYSYSFNDEGMKQKKQYIFGTIDGTKEVSWIFRSNPSRAENDLVGENMRQNPVQVHPMPTGKRQASFVRDVILTRNPSDL